jgi:hypothetical protein
VAQPTVQRPSHHVSAFNTPTVVHFCAALFVSAMLSAPWQALSLAALLLGVCGLAGAGYAALVARRLTRVDSYRPDWEDWLWHAILPMLAYLTLLCAAILVSVDPEPALFGIGLGTLALLFIGIHNCWDIVAFVATSRLKVRDDSEA